MKKEILFLSILLIIVYAISYRDPRPKKEGFEDKRPDEGSGPMLKTLDTVASFMFWGPIRWYSFLRDY